MKDDHGKIRSDRAGDTSLGSGNSPAIVYSIDISYERIIEGLHSRGFSDARSAEAGYLLERVSYRHISPYLAIVEAHPKETSPTVQEAHDAMTFDRRYQSMLFKYIGIIESQIRAQYSHWMGALHGEFALYDEGLFLRADKHANSVSNLNKEILRGTRKSKPLRVECEKNGQRLPIERGVELATLGTLMRFYSNTADRKVTARVSDSFGCTKNELASWMKTVTDVRNICAHFDRYATRKQIPSTPLRIEGIDNADHRGTFYVVPLILRLLSAKAIFLDLNLSYTYRMCCDLSEIVGQFEKAYPHLTRPMGVPQNWREISVQAANHRVEIARMIEIAESKIC